MNRASSKEQHLADWLRAQQRAAIGYSGGVDSTYLAAVAVDVLGNANVLAIIGRSASYPESQWRAARHAADAIGLQVHELDTHEMDDPRYAANPTNRCYFCKTELWERVVPVAQSLGFGVVMDGTNADDLVDHRPGLRAAREHGVESPLADFGFSKLEIRDASAKRGLPTWNQPSSPCLASRVPYGTPVTVSRLRRVEHAEAALRELGVTGDLRVRHFGDRARVELSAAELARWSDATGQELIARVLARAGYTQVEIDPRGFRSGAMNELAPIERR